jgi:hypothetical protein
MKKFKQYRNNCEQLRLVEQKKKIETEKKVLRLKIKRDGKEGGNPEEDGGGENNENDNNPDNEEDKVR